MSEFVTIVNRSSKTLHGVWDGRHYDIEPGKHQFSRLIAQKFKEQNPIMGSENFLTGDKDYLIGIVEDNDPVDPAEQTDEIELWRTAKVRASDKRVEVVKGKNGLYASERQASLPLDSTFVKP